MYLINETYLTREMYTPNTGGGVDISSADNKVAQYIDKYARLLLQNALGNVLFAELDVHILDGNLKDDAPQKWKDFINGVEYSYSGETYTFKGVLSTEGAFKESVLAYYCYYHYMKDNFTQTTSFGESVSSSVNSETVNGSSKLINIWNKYVDLYQGNRTKVQGTLSYKNGVPFYDYFNDNNGYVNLIQYLEHRSDVYQNASLRLEDGFLNSFGL